ncbi:MAG: ABC transporter ATP-binding protein [Hyphomicrobiaceae bacterium]
MSDSLAVSSGPVAAPAAGAILEIRNLSHTYPGGTEALAAVDLDVPHGIYGLLGPNGAGKTTLMRIVATLQRPTVGTVRFDGIDILAEPQRLRRVLGYLPQEFGVYPRISAEDLLDHLAVLKGLGPAGPRREQVHALLQVTNLYEVRKRAVAGFSGGMRRRFGIAQALLGDPRLIIVDEPTAGLDPAERARFHDLLAEIGENVVVVLSTHILDDVSKLCRRLAILLKGRVVAAGDLTALVADLSGHIWRKSVTRAQADDLRQTLQVLTTRYVDDRIVLHVRSERSPGEGFEPVGGDLHDVYFAMTTEQERGLE